MGNDNRGAKGEQYLSARRYQRRRVCRRAECARRDVGGPNAHPALDSSECPRGAAAAGGRERGRLLAYSAKRVADAEVANAECSPDRAARLARVPDLHACRSDRGYVHRLMGRPQGRCRRGGDSASDPRRRCPSCTARVRPAVQHGLPGIAACSPRYPRRWVEAAS